MLNNLRMKAEAAMILLNRRHNKNIRIPAKRFLTFAAILILQLGNTINAVSQTEFAGNLDGVSITDAQGTNSAPTAVFTYTRDGDIFTFDASGSSDSDGSITEYKWDFGDSSTGSESVATHIYNSDGIYPVTLTTIDNHNAVALNQLKINTIQIKSLFQWDMETTTSAINKSGESITMISSGGAQISSQGFTGNAIDLNGGYHSNYAPQTMSPDQFISHTAGKITIYGKRLKESDPLTLFYCSNNEVVNALVLQVSSTTLVEVTFGGTKVYNYQSGGSLKLATDLNWHKFELSWDSAGSIKLVVDETNTRSHTFTNGLQSPITKLAIGTLSGTGYGFIDNLTIE